LKAVSGANEMVSPKEGRKRCLFMKDGGPKLK